MSFRPTFHRAAWVVAFAPLAVGICTEAQRAQSGSAAASAEYFEAKIRPVLVANCYDCHAEQVSAGLRLDSRDALLKGGRSGPAIVAGDPDKSLLIQAVRQTSDKLKMPKGGRLRPDEIDALVEWVRAGATWPAFAATAATAAKPADVSTAAASKSADASSAATGKAA